MFYYFCKGARASPSNVGFCLAREEEVREEDRCRVNILLAPSIGSHEMILLLCYLTYSKN